MIAPDGVKIIVITLLIFILFILLTYFFPILPLKILTGIIAIIFLFNFYFFRDPERSIPDGNELILSPADGTVVLIEEVEEPYYFKSKVRRVSIFLSVFNVHVRGNFWWLLRIKRQRKMNNLLSVSVMKREKYYLNRLPALSPAGLYIMLRREIRLMPVLDLA